MAKLTKTQMLLLQHLATDGVVVKTRKIPYMGRFGGGEEVADLARVGAANMSIGVRFSHSRNNPLISTVRALVKQGLIEMVSKQDPSSFDDYGVYGITGKGHSVLAQQ